MDNKKNTSKPRTAKIALGTILVIAGTLMFGRNLGLNIPYWLTSWPLLVIMIGVISGIKHRFTKPGAYIMILIGSIFLLNDIIPGFQLHEVIFPIAITTLGIFLILKRNAHPFAERCKEWHQYKHCNRATQQ